MSWADAGGLLTGVETAVAAVLVILQLHELNKQAISIVIARPDLIRPKQSGWIATALRASR
ncbi:MAG: hypothetical protein WAW96_14785 [Alphaproteobacteria bacterium]